MTSNRSVSEMVERAAVEAALARAYSRFGDVLAAGAAIGMVRDEIAASSQAQSDDVVERDVALLRRVAGQIRTYSNMKDAAELELVADRLEAIPPAGGVEERPDPLDAMCAKVEADAVAGLRYIERHYGRLEGVGWDRVFDAHDELFRLARERDEARATLNESSAIGGGDGR